MPPELGPVPSLLDPRRDRVLVGARGDAQLSCGPGSRLVKPALAGAEQDTRYLGQQVRAVAGYLAQLGDRRGGLGLGRLTPLSVPFGDTIQARNEQTVTGRSGTIMSHSVRIELICDKSKLAEIVLFTYLARKEGTGDGGSHASVAGQSAATRRI